MSAPVVASLDRRPLGSPAPVSPYLAPGKWAGSDDVDAIKLREILEVARSCGLSSFSFEDDGNCVRIKGSFARAVAVPLAAGDTGAAVVDTYVDEEEERHQAELAEWRRKRGEMDDPGIDG